MMLSAPRSWVRVLALFTLLFALASGITAYHAPRYEAPYHALETRQSIASPSSAAFPDFRVPRPETPVLESWQEQKNRHSLPVHIAGHVLQGKAQPPPCAWTSFSPASQACVLACGTAHTASLEVCSVDPTSTSWPPQALYFQQSYSRPPPSLI